MGTREMICEWIGQGEGCDQPALEGRSYCEHHIWQIYQKGTKLGKRKKDQRTANDVFMWQSLMHEAMEELELEGVI